MSVYLVGNVTITDAERYAEYRKKIPAIFEQYGGKYVARGGVVHTREGGTRYSLEGEPAYERLIVAEFESVAAAMRFYNSPEYAPLIKIRKESTRSQVSLFEPFAAFPVLE